MTRFAPGVQSGFRSIPRIPVLDGWRGLSIVAVLMGHMLPLGPKRFQLNGMFANIGMAVFFTLSGFLITTTLIYRPSVRDFVVRRLCRIVPLAWLYFLIALPVGHASLSAYLPHFLFYANLPPFWLLKITAHMWSLCVEVQFYAAIACLFALLRRKGLLLIPALCGLVTLARIWTGTPISIVTWFRVDEILAGGCLALIYEGMLGSFWPDVFAKLSPVVPAALLFLSCHPASGSMGYLRPYLAAAMVGATLYSGETQINRFLRGKSLGYLAHISYALYVWHLLTQQGWLGSGEPITRLEKRPISIALSFLLAHLSTYYYEEPWMAWGKRLTRRKTQQRVVA